MISVFQVRALFPLRNLTKLTFDLWAVGTRPTARCLQREHPKQNKKGKAVRPPFPLIPRHEILVTFHHQASVWTHTPVSDGDVQPNPGPYTHQPWLYPEQTWYAEVIRHFVDSVHPIVTLGSIILCLLRSLPRPDVVGGHLLQHTSDFTLSLRQLAELATSLGGPNCPP